MLIVISTVIFQSKPTIAILFFIDSLNAYIQKIVSLAKNYINIVFNILTCAIVIAFFLFSDISLSIESTL